MIVMNSKATKENKKGYTFKTHLIVNVVSALHLFISHNILALLPLYPL